MQNRTLTKEVSLSSLTWMVTILALVIAVLVFPTPARAEVYTNYSPDLLLGVFYVGDDNFEDNMYLSWDGHTLVRQGIAIKNVFRDHIPTNPERRGHSCPSLMWHNGCFWIISAWNRNDGRFWPVVSYSPNLVDWTYPEGDYKLTGTKGIELDVLPDVDGAPFGQFDVVAPDWYVAPDGRIWVVFSAGYYGSFHGHPMDDQMQAYIVEITELSQQGMDRHKVGDHLWPRHLTMWAGTAHRIPFTAYAEANYIDGTLFWDAGHTWLSIKRDGMYAELWQADDLEHPESWQLVVPEMSYGWEGQSFARIGDTLFMYADHIVGSSADGVQVASARATAGPWSSFSRPAFVTRSGTKLSARHGSVLTLRHGTEAYTTARRLLEFGDVGAQRFTAEQTGANWEIHSFENPATGESIETARYRECKTLSDAGWTYRGVCGFWENPQLSTMCRPQNTEVLTQRNTSVFRTELKTTSKSQVKSK